MFCLDNVKQFINIYDVVAYIHKGYMYCLLCMEENNYEMVNPIFGFIEFKNKHNCEGCNSELPLKIADWECISCGTMNKHYIKKCDGCDFEKGKKLKY